MKTARLKLGKKNLEIILPRFYFHISKNPNEKNKYEIHLSGVNDSLYGNVQSFDSGIQENYRHIHLSELSELFTFEERDFRERDIISQLFLDYFFERGIDLKKLWKEGIWVNEGVSLNGNKLTIYKNIDTKIESVDEPGYDTTIGHKKIKNKNIEQKKFDIKKLFEKYNLKEEKETSLKNLNKSNLELVEYLFDKEFDDLHPIFQKAKFLLPPNLSARDLELKMDYGQDIWPLSVDFSLNLPKKLKKDQCNFKISSLILNEVTITPYQNSCGHHLIVRDLEQTKNQ